jgi:hypothetical protein
MIKVGGAGVPARHLIFALEHLRFRAGPGAGKTIPGHFCALLS